MKQVIYICILLFTLFSCVKKEENEAPVAVLEVRDGSRGNMHKILDASSSKDKDGTISEYDFIIVAPSEGKRFEIVSDSPIVDYAFPSESNYIVYLKVIDKEGATGTTEKKVSISN